LTRHSKCLLLFSLVATTGQSQTWNKIEPAELVEKSPQIEKDADAEVLLWRVRIWDENASGHWRTRRSEYLRIKIFNNRGRNRLSTVNLTFAGKLTVFDIAGRTIRSDGSVLEVKPDAIVERTTKQGNATIRQKTFPLPGVEPGSIIEFQWQETREDASAHYVRLDFQRDIPVREVTYEIKPFISLGFNWDMRFVSYNVSFPPMEKTRDGFNSLTVRNQPAYPSEPDMPPPNVTRAWGLIYYVSRDRPTDPAKFWADVARNTNDLWKQHSKISKSLTDAARKIAAPGKTPPEKLDLLSDYIRANIKSSATEAVTAEQRAEAENNKTPEDTFNQGIGTIADLRYLFYSMALSQGFDAHVAMLPSRGEIFFKQTFLDSFFLHDRAIAVKVDGQWRFYDPGGTFVPHGFLQWYHEGVPALICDQKSPEFVMTPMASAAESRVVYAGMFKLGDDGTLEGDVTATYTGHESEHIKERLLPQSPAQREETIKRDIAIHAATAEVTGIVMENAADPEKPFVYRCHVRAAGYAQRTGKRLIFPPAFFRQGIPARYPVSERKTDLYYEYARREEESDTIDVPPGFEFEHPEIPKSIAIGDIESYGVTGAVSGGTRFLYTRTFSFGGHDPVLLPQNRYGQVKAVFDGIWSSDAISISIKQTAATGSGGKP